MKKYVLYHDNCIDGFLSAYTVWKHYDKNCEFIPCKYGDPLPYIENNSEVYILDFSYDRNTIIDLYQRSDNLIVIDHHKAAEKELQRLPYCIFNLNECGSTLTYEYFKSLFVPQIYTYVRDYDLYKMELGGTMAVDAFLRSLNRTFKAWYAKLRTMGINNIIRRGKDIINFKNQQVLDICKNVHFKSIGGFNNVPVCNNFCNINEVCHKLLEMYPDAPFTASYFTTQSGDTKWSLRSEDNRHDVSAIAKSYNGGGHRNAAGFQGDI